MNMPKGLSFKVAAALVLALVLGLLASAQTSAAGPVLSIGRTTVAVDAGVTLALESEGVGGPGLGGWIVDISYDDDILDVVACDSHPAGFCNMDFASNVIRTIGATADGIDGDVILADITFECREEGSTALAIFAKEFVDATVGNPQDVNVKVSHGSIGCVEAGGPPTPSQLGDVNCDGRVDSRDAALVLQYTARLIRSLPCPQNADMNDDGRITAVDATLILQQEAGLI
jgi:hypothetical protein